MAENVERQEAEIQLIDILRILWKWKFLIAGVTFACVLVVGIVNYTSPKIYSVESIIQTGILRINEDGTYVYLDSVENIKALISEGTFNHEIISLLRNQNKNNFQPTIQFKVTSPKDSETIKVNYETANIRQGIEIQKALNQLLYKKYSYLVDYFRNEYDTQLRIKDNIIKTIQANIVSHENNINNLNNQVNELIADLESIKKNTMFLSNERDRFLSNSQTREGILPALLYSNTIQQNLALINKLKEDIAENRMQKEAEILKRNDAKKQMAEMIELRDSLMFKKKNVQNIQILQPPTAKPNPIRPKILFNIFLAFVFSMFVSTFISFLLEYISKAGVNTPR